MELARNPEIGIENAKSFRTDVRLRTPQILVSTSPTAEFWSLKQYSRFFQRLKASPKSLLEKAPNWLGVRTQPKFTQNWNRGASVLRGESPALPEIHFQKAFTKLHIIFEASKLCEFIYQFLYFQISKLDIGFYIYNFDFCSYTFQNRKYRIKFTDIVNIRGFSAFLLVFIGLYNSEWPLCGNCMYICILADL